LKKAINIIIALLLALALVFHVTQIIFARGYLPVIISEVTTIALCILILYYNFFGYKKPHGNLLKYIFLIFGFALIISTFFNGGVELSGLIYTMIGTIVVYMSGRLNKIEKNRKLAVVVLILFTVLVIISVFRIDVSFETAHNAAVEMPQMYPSGKQEMQPKSLLSILGTFTTPLQWIALSLAYISRYKEHKEAGLLDKVKD